MQHEITKKTPLLDGNGNLIESGYAKKLLPVYNRENVKGGFMRLKEWDYYYVGNDAFGVAMTIADNSYMGLDSISFLSFKGKPWEITKSPMRILPMGKTNLPLTSEKGVSKINGKGYSICFEVSGGTRHLLARMENFRGTDTIEIDISLSREPQESMVICTPFDKKAHFYYNQKINCMRAAGKVTIGEDTFVFSPENSFGVLDWGRGVWTYKNTWYWGSASGLADGVDFGFNIGYGFGNTSAASENMLFYNGKAHKLSQVKFNIPMKDGKEDYMKPWRFTSDDGRFELHFCPVIDRASNTDFKILGSDQHQVFGYFNGVVKLDDGTIIEVKDLFGFAEKVSNKW